MDPCFLTSNFHQLAVHFHELYHQNATIDLKKDTFQRFPGNLHSLKLTVRALKNE